MTKKAKKTNSKNSQIHTGVLVLENKKVFKGIGIGYQGEATGEVCFNTSLTGYQEIISDPSYAGQIINFTFPHIGNVGTNKEDYESDKIWTKGVIFNSEITSAHIFFVSSSPSCLGKKPDKISSSFCSTSKRSVLLFFL